MRRLLLLLTCLPPAACGDARDTRSPADTASATEATAAPAAAAAPIATPSTMGVTGRAEHLFYGGAVLRDVRFDVGMRPDGTPGGSVEIVLQGSDDFSGHADQSEEPLRFDVTCLAIEGARAWIGGRSRGRAAGLPAAFGDVWYVEDGGAAGPDRIGVWAGYTPEECGARPEIPWAAPVERGGVVIRAR